MSLSLIKPDWMLTPISAAEMSTGRNRQKHLSIGTTLFWVSAWAVTFTLPYLFQPQDAGLGPMIGFVSTQISNTH